LSSAPSGVEHAAHCCCNLIKKLKWWGLQEWFYVRCYTQQRSGDESHNKLQMEIWHHVTFVEEQEMLIWGVCRSYEKSSKKCAKQHIGLNDRKTHRDFSKPDVWGKIITWLMELITSTSAKFSPASNKLHLTLNFTRTTDSYITSCSTVIASLSRFVPLTGTLDHFTPLLPKSGVRCVSKASHSETNYAIYSKVSTSFKS